MSLLQIALLGAVIGVPLGYAMQRTNLCFNSAYRETVLRRNTTDPAGRRAQRWRKRRRKRCSTAPRTHG